MAEPNPTQEQEKQLDIQAEIEKARQQEREKLHADIDKLKADLADKAKTCNENYLEIANLRKEVENKGKEIAGFEEKITKAKEDGKLEGTATVENLTKELEDYKSKLAKAEKDFADYKEAETLKAYLADKVKDLDEDFRVLVKGNTQEEIDASYTQAKTLQDSVKEKYGKKVNTLPNPKTNPKKPLDTQSLVDKLKNMSLDEYKEARKKNFK